VGGHCRERVKRSVFGRLRRMLLTLREEDVDVATTIDLRFIVDFIFWRPGQGWKSCCQAREDSVAEEA
jgi:hypothetical protein